MAVPKKKAEPICDIRYLIAVIQKAVEEMLIQAQDNVNAKLGDSEDRCLVINFPAKLDYSESVPTIKTNIRFTGTYRDSRTARGDTDPNQIKLSKDLPPEEEAVNAGDKENGGD